MSQLEQRLTRAIGDRYALEREVGRGGMATVYLAEDRRHGRHVALKVLRPELAQALGAERFLREIEIAAKLSHPRIVPLLDSGTADELLFYVMPYVEGESLRDRLARETQLPVDEALEITRQTAAALAYAHSHGIVHRDIKPENILLTAGEVLVTDFGIARAVTAAGGAHLTESGIAVGTPAYMSPEQASGASDINGRSDLYSLACVLYELLAGEPPFTGPTAQAITARKLSESAPDVAVVRETVPPALAETLRKALARVPADRHATAVEFAEALRQAHGPARRAATDRSADPRAPHDRRRRLVVSGAFALLGALAVWGWLRPPVDVLGEPLRMHATLPPGVSLTRGPGFGASSIALSPDGRTLVLAGTDEQGQRLYQRPLDRLEAMPLAGAEGGSGPFFSPDGGWIGFYAGGRLKRMPAGGGAVLDIAAVPGSGFPAGASWGPDDRIVFASGSRSPLHVVSARGGDPEPLTQLDVEAGEVSHQHPEILPDGRTLLFDSGGWLHALDLVTGRRVALVPGVAPRYASSGHLILSRGSDLWATSFDPSSLEVSSALVPLVDGVALAGPARHYAVSRRGGTLAYMPATGIHALVLRDADGTERLVTEQRPVFENPQFSPDGRRLAVATRGTGSNLDIWTHDLEDESVSRLTFEGGRAPVWTPDGTAVTYSHLGERQGIYRKAADGRGDAEQLLAIDEFHWLVGWTPDARTLAFGVMEGVQDDGTSPSSIMAFADGVSRRVVGPGDVWGGRLSPDGRWLAYYSRESGEFEVYVTPFPEGGTRWQISDNGGRDPTWGPDGTEVYYRSGDQLMATRIDTDAGVRVRSRRLVVQPFSPPLYDDYDIHPVNGRTLVLVRPVGDAERREVTIVLNWLTELRRSAER